MVILMVGRRLALVIGNNYPNSSRELKFAVADAKKIKEVLENKDICMFDEVFYLEDRPSKEAYSAVEEILQTANEDLVFIYFSGHGEKDFEDNLCLVFNDTEKDKLLSTSLTFDFISKCVRYPTRKSVVIVLDCCFSGLAGIRDGNINVTENIKKLSGLGTVVLTSTGSTGYTKAKEDEKLGHGIFTYYLIEGLEKGHADKDLNGLISIDELYYYASKKTKENSSQSPAMNGRIEGSIFIGMNPNKVTDDYELNKKKLHVVFDDPYEAKKTLSQFSNMNRLLKKLENHLGKSPHITGLVLIVMILVVTLSMASNIIEPLASNRTVSEPMRPFANFSVTPTSGNAPLEVTFTDNSTNPLYKSPLYKWWNFGDGTGTGSSANTINHTYFNAGKYKVYLKVTNAVGNNTSEPMCITVNKNFYTFDPNNGDDGKSLWGISISSLPSYKTYHLPAKEGYIVVQNQYDFIDETTSNYLYPDPTDGNGFYISTLSPDKGHWSWSGSYTPYEEDSTKGLIPGSQDHVSNKSMPSGKGSKVRIYSPYTKMNVIAVVGESGPAPRTGCQFGASNKVFKALGLPDSYNGSSKENPNPGYGSNTSDPAKYPVIKYADTPYWVEVTWADQSLPAGPLTSSNRSR
jgi:PKD repeat protein/uncharacterized caspase-like protein